jgi:predicted regulator of amino acid metabolism with ACT domain
VKLSIDPIKELAYDIKGVNRRTVDNSIAKIEKDENTNKDK